MILMKSNRGYSGFCTIPFKLRVGYYPYPPRVRCVTVWVWCDDPRVTRFKPYRHCPESLMGKGRYQNINNINNAKDCQAAVPVGCLRANPHLRSSGICHGHEG